MLRSYTQPLHISPYLARFNDPDAAVAAAAKSGHKEYTEGTGDALNGAIPRKNASIAYRRGYVANRRQIKL